MSHEEEPMTLENAFQWGILKPSTKYSKNDATYDNVPCRHEDIVLDPGQKKVEEEVDTRKSLANRILGTPLGS